MGFITGFIVALTSIVLAFVGLYLLQLSIGRSLKNSRERVYTPMIISILLFIVAIAGLAISLPVVYPNLGSESPAVHQQQTEM